VSEMSVSPSHVLSAERSMWLYDALDASPDTMAVDQGDTCWERLRSAAPLCSVTECQLFKFAEDELAFLLSDPALGAVMEAEAALDCHLSELVVGDDAPLDESVLAAMQDVSTFADDSG